MGSTNEVSGEGATEVIGSEAALLLGPRSGPQPLDPGARCPDLQVLPGGPASCLEAGVAITSQHFRDVSGDNAICPA